MAFTRSLPFTLLLSISLVATLLQPTAARAPLLESQQPAGMSVAPAYCAAEHSTGKIAFTVSNYGVLGTGFARSTVDCFTGLELHSCEFPRKSGKEYLFGGAVWIGAVVGTDTLVSVGADGWVESSELHPDEAPFGNMQTMSTLDTAFGYDPNAVSHRDFVAVYTDTYTSGVTGLALDEIDHRPHKPLEVEITQKSYSWGYPTSEDFVVLEYTVKNIGSQSLSELYFGLFVDGDIWQAPDVNGHQDDITGFRATVPVTAARCSFELDLPTMWFADDDGELSSAPSAMDLSGVSALTLLQSPLDQPKVSYNWWTSIIGTCTDYGPQMHEHFRDLGTGGMGTPAGDRNKYHFLSNGELDFDLVYTGTIDSLDPVWIGYWLSGPCTWSYGTDIRGLLSVGPINLGPGQSVPYYFAYSAGAQFHVDPDNFANHIIPGPYDPDAFTNGLSFGDLQTNIQHAYWMFDLPGVDTDSDGYFGQFMVCDDDTLFYAGDGVPDLTPSRTVTAFDFLRAWPPENSTMTGDSVTFSWTTCPTTGGVEYYDLSVKVGAITVTLTDVQDTSVTVGLNDKAGQAGPIPVEWWVTAKSRPFTYATRDGHGMFVYDVATTAEPPAGEALPTSFALEQNYPNPFNPSTQIDFALPHEAAVVIEIYNIAGQRVRLVLDRTLPAGWHSVTWDGTSIDGSEAASGVYFCRLRAGEFTSSKKMILAR